MYLDQSLGYFLDRLASSSPTPGGGSVAALAGALGASLVSMVANLTLGKEKYKDVQPEIESLLKESEKLRSEMQALIQKDVEVFGQLSQVYKMPKTSEAEKTARFAAMQVALINACQVPLDIGVKSLEVAQLTRRSAEIGAVAAVSDAGVAAILAGACARSAALNVKININSIKNSSYNQSTWLQMQDILQQVADIEKSVMETTYSKLG